MFERPTKTNKTQAQKIKPITCYVICEGYVDETKYFKAIESRIRNRYKGNLVFVPIERATTASAPKKVFEELEKYIKENNVSFGPRSDSYAFMIIDKDHHFSDNHVQGTLNAIEACSKLHVKVLINVPSFEIWEICHFKDVSSENEEYLAQLYANRKTSKRAKPFAKKEVSKLLNGDDYGTIIQNIHVAIENENKIKQSFPCGLTPPSKVQSNVGELFNLFKEKGYDIKGMFLD